MANKAYVRSVSQESPTLQSQITSTELIIDTVDTDITVLTPDTDKGVYVKGILLSDDTATNLTFKGLSGNLTGTVATTNGSAAITGTGTAFTTQLKVGDQVVISGGDTLTIASIASNTSATAIANASTTVSGAAFTRKYQISKLLLAANQGLFRPVNSIEWAFCTRAGDALLVASSAAVDSVLIHAQQGKP